jgi:hypothetical protein
MKDQLGFKNVGVTDKRIRMAIGAVLFSGGIFTSTVLMVIVGLFAFMTGVRQKCPFYTLGKHNTLEK